MAREYRLSPEINLVLPERSEDDISSGLRYLTEVLHINGLADAGGFGLGGEYGYGAEFQNGTFTMYRFWWGDCECGWEDMEFDEPHEEYCYQVALKAAEKAEGVHWEDKFEMEHGERRRRQDAIYDRLCADFKLDRHLGCAVHCTCSHTNRFKEWWGANKKGPEGHAEDCPVERPNFYHKPTGFELRWYKWIGRDNEIKNPTNASWGSIFQSCLESLKGGLTNG